MGKKKGLGDTGSEIDAAFRASEDGDCARVKKHLDAAEADGENVDKLRGQLLKDCGVERSRWLGMLDGLSHPLWVYVAIYGGAAYLAMKVLKPVQQRQQQKTPASPTPSINQAEQEIYKGIVVDDEGDGVNN